MDIFNQCKFSKDGNTISQENGTERMRMDTSGRLLIGNIL